MVTPAIENIVKCYPESEIVLYGSYLATEIFQAHPQVKEIITDESRKTGSRYFTLYKTARKLGKFDILLSFRSSFSTKFFSFFVDARKKCIYRKEKGMVKHQVVRYNDFVNRCFGINAEPKALTLYLSNEIAVKRTDRKYAGINPGASYGSAKRWYPEKFADVAVALSRTYDIIIFGGPGETDIAGDIEKRLCAAGVENYVNLAGKTSIAELMGKIASLDLFITGDSGPMHVAAAFGIPTVALFGPTKDTETSQWKNPKGVIVKKEMACAPCMKRTCPLGHHACMREIGADEVLKAVSTIVDLDYDSSIKHRVI